MPKHIKLIKFLAPVFGFLKKIPKGRVVSYGLVAKRCGLPNPRLVGRILKQNTEPEKIPCFRVIRADGRLADGYKFGGLIGQTKRLRADGIEFDGARIKNFNKILWKGRR
jgi:O-6-methylguanine DNA methyltransferase